MIRHKKTTILLDATEETTVAQLKATLQGIMKREPEEQQLYKIDTKQPLEDNSTLGDCGYRSSNAKAQEPATIGLRFKIGNKSTNTHVDLVCCVVFIVYKNICLNLN